MILKFLITPLQVLPRVSILFPKTTHEITLPANTNQDLKLI